MKDNLKKLETYPRIEFRVPAGFTLTSRECRILLTKGRKLFETAEFTIEAKKVLVDNPDLAKVIEKW